jgi:hypothetical protein
MPPVRPTLIAIAAGLAVVAVGCGGSDSSGGGSNAKRYSGEEKKVAQVIDNLVAASHAGDANKICTQVFSPGLATAVAARNKKTCAATVQAQLVSPKEDITITSIRVQGSTAFLTVREQNKNVSRLSLVQQNGGWRINTIQ